MKQIISNEILEKTHSGSPFAVFLDIDGTMVSTLSLGGVSPRLASAISNAKEKGHKFFVNSGRGFGFIPRALINSADFDGIVSGMGSYVTYHGEQVYCSRLPEELMMTVLDYCEANGESVLLEGVPKTEDHDGRFCFGESGVFGVKATFSDKNELLREISKHIPTKVTTPYFPGKEYADFLSDHFEMAFMPPFYCEGALKGNNKGAGIKRVCDFLSLPYENTVAVGDSENDLGMLRSAGIAVAMGNAADAVKENCRIICDTVDNDGAAKLIEQLFL